MVKWVWGEEAGCFASLAEISIHLPYTTPAIVPCIPWPLCSIRKDSACNGSNLPFQFN